MIKITTNWDTVDVTQSGNVFGEIFFEYDGKQFPDAKWTDFLVVILGWWSKSLMDLMDGVAEKAELLFMDGPYLVKVTRPDATNLNLLFIERTETEFKPLDSVVVETSSFLTGLHDVIETVLEKCEQLNLVARDVETLKTVRKPYR